MHYSYVKCALAVYQTSPQAGNLLHEDEGSCIHVRASAAAAAGAARWNPCPPQTTATVCSPPSRSADAGPDTDASATSTGHALVLGRGAGGGGTRVVFRRISTRRLTRRLGSCEDDAAPPRSLRRLSFVAWNRGVYRGMGRGMGLKRGEPAGVLCADRRGGGWWQCCSYQGQPLGGRARQGGRRRRGAGRRRDVASAVGTTAR